MGASFVVAGGALRCPKGHLDAVHDRANSDGAKEKTSDLGDRQNSPLAQHTNDPVAKDENQLGEGDIEGIGWRDHCEGWVPVREQEKCRQGGGPSGQRRPNWHDRE